MTFFNYKNPAQANATTKKVDNSSATRNNASDLNFKPAEILGYQPHIDNLVKKNNKTIRDDALTSQSGPKARLINSIAKFIEQERIVTVTKEQDINRIKYDARKEAISLVSSLSSNEINTLSKASPDDIKLILRATE